MFGNKPKFPDPASFGLINPIIAGAAEELCPDRVKDGMLTDVKYAWTTTYPLAEYTSTARFATKIRPPLQIAWNGATRMLAQAFDCMSNSDVMNLDDSMAWCDRTTSPGYPWQLSFANKGEMLDSDIFMNYYMRFEAGVLQGNFYPCFWRTFIKKEFKKIDKILNDEPRTVCSAPGELNVLGNRLFASMNAKMCEAGSRGEIPCYVGVTKFNRNWHTLVATKLHRFPNLGDGDFGFFDGTVHSVSFGTIRRLRKSWMKSARWRVAINYYYACVVYAFLVGILGDLFMKMMGQPSGQTNTLTDNSLIQCLYWFYHWCLVVCPNLNLSPTWECFKQHVCLIVMGDDVIYSYSDLVKPFMRQSVVARTFSTMGLIFKYSVDGPAPLVNLEFCSTMFRKYKGIYVPLLKPEKMLTNILCRQVKSPRMCLRRLISLRVDVFFDIKLRSLIDGLVRYIRETYWYELNLPVTGRNGDDQTYDQIMATAWPDLVIEDHYLKPVL